jgi:hypothetical protein
VLIGLECAGTQRQQPPIFTVAEIGGFERGRTHLTSIVAPIGSGATMRVKKDKSGLDDHGVDDKHYTSFVMIDFLN